MLRAHLSVVGSAEGTRDQNRATGDAALSPWALPCLGRPLWPVVAEILEPQAQICSPPSLGGGPHTPGLRAGVSPAGQHGCRKALPTQSRGAAPPGWVSEARCPSLLSWAVGALCPTAPRRPSSCLP